MEIINIIAIVLSPVIAVLITIWLNNRGEKKRAKMDIFKTLMATRYIGNTTHEKVRALNSIDVIFSDAPKVRKAWQDLYNTYQIQQPDNEKQRDGLLLLLEAMATELGYKEKIKWDSIKSVYLPTGLFNEMQAEAIYKTQQIELLQNLSQQYQHANVVITETDRHEG